MKYVTKLLDKNTKEVEVKDRTWIIWLTIALGIYLFIIMSVMYMVKSTAESVVVNGYINTTCQNTKCTLIKWNNRLIFLPLY